MKSFLSNIALKIWPDFESLAEPDRFALLRELFGTLYSLPFVVVAVVWLIAETDLTLLREQWLVLLLMLGLSVLAGRFSFFQITVGPDGRYDYNGSSLEIVIVTSAMLLFGPTAVWVPFLVKLINYGLDRPPSPSTYQHWNRIRNLVYNLGPGIVGLLLALWIYQGLGGQFPLSQLTLAAAWPTFAAVLFWLPWDGLFILSYGFLLTHFQLVSQKRREEGAGFGKRALPNGRLDILIADVADKGMGVALFMALSRTLIRTYAFEHQTRPELVLRSTNQRILTDTHNDMYVTAFYGILDSSTGQLTYANAGHNPPYFFKACSSNDSQDLVKPQGLRNTGMPLGILEEADWEAKTIVLDHGDTLILYTDGVTEAQNLQDEFFGDQRLLETSQENLAASVITIQEAILSAVDRFSDAGAQCDDETLVIIKRQ